MPRSRQLVVIIVIGLLARLVYVGWYPQQPVVFDAEGYDRTAVTLVNTGVYPASGRASPLYSFFLAGVYRTFGYSHVHARAAQAALVSVTALLVFLLGRQLFGESQGVIAAGIVSVYPGLAAYSGLLLTETVFALLVAVFTCCFLQVWRSGGWMWSVLTGLALGVATLCRSEIVGVVVPVAAFLVWKRPSRTGVRDSALLLLATALTVTPWAARQYSNRDSGVVVTGGIGATLWLSTHPGDWHEWYAEREPLRSLIDCNCSAEELDRLLIRAAIRNVAESPVEYAWMSGKRLVRFWIGSHGSAVLGLETSFRVALENRDAMVLAVKGLLLILNTVLIVVAGFALYTERMEWRDWLPVVLVIAYVNFVHVALFSTSRYQIPVMPLVAVFAAAAASRLVVGPTVRRR